MMMLGMPIHYLITLLVDIGVIILLMAIFYRTGRSTGGIRQIDTIQIKSLESSLKGIMADSAKNSNELIARLDEKMNDLNMVIKKTEEKETALKQGIRQAQELLKSFEDTKKQKKDSVTLDPYQKAADLISRGYTSEDVQKESGLSINEIDLIKQLVRYRSN